MSENNLTLLTDDSNLTELVILEEGIEVEYTKAYGIGIDVHSKFIQVSVLVKILDHYYEFRREFPTDWPSLCQAAEWAKTILQLKADPPISDIESIHYCLEATSVYHFPVIEAWGGIVSVVTPSIAGATKRKTDVLDAKLLALQDLTSIWPQTYISSSDIKELRVLLSAYENYKTLSTSSSNQINNYLIRFGINLGREGSVTKKKALRSEIEDLCTETPSMDDHPTVNPKGIPADVKPVILSLYSEFDFYKKSAQDYFDKVVDKIRLMEWATRDAMLPGSDMLDILMSAPGIGLYTACTWLAYIITPVRFPNAKSVAAYCSLDPSLKTSAKRTTSTTKRGGVRPLHSVLTQAASSLMKNHNEMFGKWGYQIYLQTGKWKKGTNAVARKLSIALYYMQSTGQKFSYEKYNLIKEIKVIDISVEELSALNTDFKRYLKILKANDITTTSQMANLYYTCELHKYKGLGKKFFSCMKDFVTDQSKYRKLHQQYESASQQSK